MNPLTSQSFDKTRLPAADKSLVGWLKFFRHLALSLLLVPLSACFEEEKFQTSYVAYNHTDKSIVSIIINGKGGILGARAQGEGGEMCCVILPKKWRPGLKATIKWQEDDTVVLDAKGKPLMKDGVPIVVEAPWKERTVEVPKYSEKLGQFYIHFLPNDEVKVAVSLYGPSHPDHPYYFKEYRSESENRSEE